MIESCVHDIFIAMYNTNMWIICWQDLFTRYSSCQQDMVKIYEQLVNKTCRQDELTRYVLVDDNTCLQYV